MIDLNKNLDKVDCWSITLLQVIDQVQAVVVSYCTVINKCTPLIIPAREHFSF